MDRESESMGRKPISGAQEQGRNVRGSGDPGWGLPAYLLGLVLIYIGERLVGGEGNSRWAFSASGASLAVVATFVRLISSRGAPVARRRLERWLGAFSLLGLVSVALYFIGAEWLLPAWESGAEGAEAAAAKSGLFRSVWVALLALALVPLIFGETALRPMRNSARPELGRARAALTAGSVLALALTYVVLLVYAVGAQEWKVDYSYFKTSRPGESTRNIAKSMGQPVKVHAFFPAVNEVQSEVYSYFRELAQSTGGKLTIESHDRLLSPKYSRKYKVSRDGTIVMVKGNSEASFYVGSDMEDARPKLKELDETVQKNLLKLAREMRVAYLTVGHGELNDEGHGKSTDENSGKIAKQILSALGYRTKNLGIADGLGREVPDDATVVVVLGPSEPFAPEELGTLERYSRNGGKLLLALDPSRAIAGSRIVQEADSEVERETGRSGGDRASSPAASSSAGASGEAPAPSSLAARSGEGTNSDEGEEAEAPANPFYETLNRLAAIGGTKLEPALLASELNHMRRRSNRSDRVLFATNHFSSHAAVSTMSRNVARGAAVGLFAAGSLEALPSSPGAKADFAVKTPHGVFRDSDGDFEKDPGEKSGSFRVAAALSIPLATTSEPEPAGKKAKDGSPEEEGGIPEEGRVFVMADADGFSDLILGQSRPQQYFLADVVRWLGGEESFSGAVSSEKDVPIEHTRDEDVVWFYSTIFGVPAFVLAIGLLGSRRRRRGGKR